MTNLSSKFWNVKIANNLLIVSVLMLFVGLSNRAIAQSAQVTLKRCLAAFGGLEKIEKVQYIKTNYYAHGNMLEQSERPEGPYIVSYENGNELLDLSKGRFYKRATKQSILFKSTMDQVFNGEVLAQGNKGRMYPMPPDYAKQAQMYLWQNPLFVLAKAAVANDLAYAGIHKLQGVDNDHLTFSYQNIAFHLYINQNTHLLTSIAFEHTLPSNFFWSIWGKFTTQVYYSLYHLLPQGYRYPQQWDIYRHKMPFETYTFTKVTLLESIPENELAQFKLKESVINMLKKRPQVNAQNLSLSTKSKFEINPHLFGWRHYWNVGVIVQTNGVYIIEAPMSGVYSKQIIAAVKKKYPNKKIQGVICTSDAWPHIGGVRQYVASKIPVYTQALNQPLIERILQSDYSNHPDDLHGKSIKPKFKLLRKKMILGDKTNPAIVVPALGEGAERMLFIYFPKYKVLYASDMVQYNARSKSFFMPQYLSEVKSVVDREKWEVKQVFAMHTLPMAWQKVEEALMKIKQAEK